MGFTEESFALLEGLEANNDRDWFNARKDAFETHLRAPFAAALEALSLRLADAPLPLEGSRRTMFRMHRDVRFSPDKRPYKTSVSGLLTASGTKDESGGLAYLHFDARGGFAAVGYHMLSPKALAPVRRRMIDEAEAFAEMRDHLAARGRALDPGNALTAMPRGFSDYAEHPHADAIRLKSLLVREDLSKAAWLSGDVTDRVEALVRDAMPLLAFVGRVARQA